VHAAQGVTADASYAILGEGASRAMAYVAMTRGRHNNEAYFYQKFGQDADHEHAKTIASPGIHQLHRGNMHSAAYYFRQILGNGDRPRSMHAEAQRAERDLLPERVAEAVPGGQNAFVRDPDIRVALVTHDCVTVNKATKLRIRDSSLGE
jgi:hypothetical protein